MLSYANCMMIIYTLLGGSATLESLEGGEVGSELRGTLVVREDNESRRFTKRHSNLICDGDGIPCENFNIARNSANSSCARA